MKWEWKLGLAAKEAGLPILFTPYISVKMVEIDVCIPMWMASADIVGSGL